MGRARSWICCLKVWFLLLVRRKGQSQVRKLVYAYHTLKAVVLGRSLRP